MKEITDKLQFFLNNTDVFDSIPKLSLSATTTKLLSSMLPIIKKGHTLFKATPLEIHRVKTIPMGEVPGLASKTINYNVIPEIVRQRIETSMPDKKCVKIIFKIKERDYQLFFIYENLSKDEIKNRLKMTFIWLYLASYFANAKCSKTTHIFMYFTDLKKMLPNANGSPIDEEHANTAFTTSCSPESSIYLFRDEEWFKVLIHESFHNLGLDFSSLTNHGAEIIRDIFPVNSEVNLFETYCEMWAEMLNVLFVAYFNNIGKSDSVILKEFEENIQFERRFSLFQCAKVLHFFGMDYHDLYEKTTDSIKIRSHKYKENTNVLSYYILKSILMFYLNDFMGWCHEFSKGSLQFNKNVVDEYCKFIREHYKRPEFLSVIDEIEKWMDENEKNDVIWRTLRMTVTEI